MPHQSNTVTLPAPELPPAQSKWEREHLAFLRLLPRLLATERGKYVAIHNERVVDTDTDETALMTRVLSQVGNVDIHVGLVTDEPERVHRSGVVREI